MKDAFFSLARKKKMECMLVPVKFFISLKEAEDLAEIIDTVNSFRRLRMARDADLYNGMWSRNGPLVEKFLGRIWMSYKSGQDPSPPPLTFLPNLPLTPK